MPEVPLDHEPGDAVGLDEGTGEPMRLLVPPSANAGDKHLLLQRLQDLYDIGLEYDGEHQTVYSLEPAAAWTEGGGGES